MENTPVVNAPNPDDAWELFFKWEHLTPKLQAASKPCCALGQQITRGEEIPEKAFTDLIIWAREALPENRQKGRAISKIEQAEEAWADPNRRATPMQEHVLDLLLEAKDCAVRSVLANN